MYKLIVLLTIFNQSLTMNLLAENPEVLLPKVAPGWEIESDTKVYNPENLYDYIDGGAELFLSYGFNNVASQIVKKGVNEIRIEIFDMINSQNAFGVFSHTRTTDEKKFGQGSQAFTGTTIFWKDRYYVSLTANDVNPTINSALEYYASEIDKLITETGQLPWVIHLLPETDQVPDGFIYFHHYIWQNSFHFISSDNFLGISDQTPAVLAKYGQADQRYYLMLIHYPSIDDCDEAMENLKTHFFEDVSDTSVIQLEDSTWWSVVTENEYLIFIFNSESAEKNVQLSELVKKNILTQNLNP